MKFTDLGDKGAQFKLKEAAPPLVRGAAGLALGGIAAAGTPALMGIFGPVFGMGLGALGAYNASHIAMQGADAIWDWAAKKLGSDDNAEQFAMAHLTAANKGEPQFEYSGKTYDVKVPQNQARAGAVEVRKMTESLTERRSQSVAEGSPRVDSLVTDALKIMRGSELNDAVQALKTVLGDREYNDRRGHYNFYVKQLVDMYSQQGMAEDINEGAEQMTPNWAKYVLDQLYNSDGAVTMTDLFDEGVPGLHDMFMATAEAHGLNTDDEFEDVQHELTLELEDLIKGGHGLDEASLAQMRDYFNQPDNNTVKVDNQYGAPERKTQAHVPPEIQMLINKMYRIGKITPQEFETLKNFQLKTKINVGLNIKEADKNPYAIGMAQAMKSTGDKPPLKKSTINKAHEIARAVKKDE